jgi:hypothetical protein
MSKFEAYEPKAVNGQNNVADVRRVGKQGAIACFVAGTKILTVGGQRPVEQLVPGDRILTRDHGLQTLRWIGCRHVDASEVAEFEAVRPIRIAKGALGNGMPDRDLLVSPEHRVMVSGDKVAELVGEEEALIAAKFLIGREGVTVEEVEAVIYYHLMFDDHELVLSEGTWTESFLPGLGAMNGMDVEAVEELYEIYPELRVIPTPFKPARASVDPVIAQMLTADAGLLVKNDA